MRKSFVDVLRVLGVVALLATVSAVPARAAGASVSVSPGTADPEYATTVQLSGSGFQSVPKGYGGIYLLFGWVADGGWQPSKGGAAGATYRYVPDKEAKDNKGFQRFIAFPGSDTASAANGGEIAANGTWSTQLVIPGAKFKATDRGGNVVDIDCQRVRCGVITVGAHGVVNANNETFTPVSFAVPKQTAAAPPPASTPPTSSEAPSSAPPTTTTEAPSSSSAPPVTFAEPVAAPPNVQPAAQEGAAGSWWWIAVVAAVVVLAGLVVPLLRLRRRRADSSDSSVKEREKS